MSSKTRKIKKLREGIILTDVLKNTWRLGPHFASGSFGEIFRLSKNSNSPATDDSSYVAKIEPISNGPLFVEKNFYVRAGRDELIQKWKSNRKLTHLGVPRHLAFGSHKYYNEHYRFLVLDRYGRDLESILKEKGGKFHLKTAFGLAIQILDALEYIHFYGFIHVDIKASNILLASNKPNENRVFLVDYGLACLFVDNNGRHKEFSSDERKAHDGTLEYTSRDAHVGAHSRRGDLEILGYNVVHWISGTLPWLNDLANPDRVADLKRYFMDNVSTFMSTCIPNDNVPECLEKYLRYVSHLDFTTRPDYTYCRNLFHQGIRDAGCTDDNHLNLHKLPNRRKRPRGCGSQDGDLENCITPRKIARVAAASMTVSAPRRPCAVVQPASVPVRITRGQPLFNLALRGKEFDWVKVLQSHPERVAKAFKLLEKRVKIKKRVERKPMVEELDASLLKEAYDPRAKPTPPMLTYLHRRNIALPSANSTPCRRHCRSDSSTSACEAISNKRRQNDGSYFPQMTAVALRMRRLNIKTNSGNNTEKKTALETPRRSTRKNVKKSLQNEKLTSLRSRKLKISYDIHKMSEIFNGSETKEKRRSTRSKSMSY